MEKECFPPPPPTLRFGKFVEIQFDKDQRISGAAIRTYLLERSRIVTINDPERNFHIFYQVCFGAEGQEKEDLRMGDAKSYRYINQSSCFELTGVDNAEVRRCGASLTSG